MEHAPQLAGSVWRSTQRVPHLVGPPVHVILQAPAEQTSPLSVAHAAEQAPQLFGSELRSTQRVPHLIGPPVHVILHVPEEQTSPLSVAHALEQAPQLTGSDIRSIQCPRQLDVPPVHELESSPGVLSEASTIGSMVELSRAASSGSPDICRQTPASEWLQSTSRG